MDISDLRIFTKDRERTPVGVGGGGGGDSPIQMTVVLVVPFRDKNLPIGTA